MFTWTQGKRQRPFSNGRKRFETSLSLLKRNRILLKFTVLKQLFRSVYLKDCQDFLKKKKKLLIFGNLFFFMEEEKIKFETSSGFCTTIIIQEIMVKKNHIYCVFT